MSSGDSIWNHARCWSSERLKKSSVSTGVSSSSQVTRLAVLGALVFFAALGVRLLHWQDSHASFQQGDDSMRTNLIKPYERESNRIREEGGLLFPANQPDLQDSRMIIHPPGYSLLLAAISKSGSSTPSSSLLRWMQIVGDAFTALTIFFIAAHWFPSPLAAIAGLLVAFSPHLAHYSLWLTPETLAVLPVAAAVFLIARCIERPRIWAMIAAGALAGVSCWLRSNGLLLAPALAIAVFLLLERERRIEYSAALVAAMITTIAPVTLRNWTAYHRFVPLSLGAGITMAEGIADYDPAGRFGMPAWDGDVKHKDAAWHDRPDYASNIWVPDGIDRDRARLSRGAAVIRSHPVWFAGVMARRAFSMLRYNDSITLGGAADIAHAPIVSVEPPFGHGLTVPETIEPIWTSSPSELMTGGIALSTGATVAAVSDGQALRVTGDDSSFGDQFAIEIPVGPHADYVLRLRARIEQRLAVAKVTSADRRIMLASNFLDEKRPTKKKAQKRARRNADRAATNGALPTEANGQMMTLDMAFASGNRSEVRLVISNNGESVARPVVEMGGAELFELGPTPHLGTSGVRFLVRAIQRNLFTTTRMLPLVAIGIVLLALAARKRELLMLLVVPVYYLSAQSAFHTEYRYILAIHYFLFVLASVTLYVGGSSIYRGLARAFVALRLVSGR